MIVAGLWILVAGHLSLVAGVGIRQIGTCWL